MLPQDNGRDNAQNLANAIPEELKQAPRWMCWNYEDGTKIPKLDSTAGVYYGSSTDTSRHRSFEEA